MAAAKKSKKADDAAKDDAVELQTDATSDAELGTPVDAAPEVNASGADGEDLAPPADADDSDSDAPADEGDASENEDSPIADEAPDGKRPLTRNISINGQWYGPAWGNAADYPDDGHDGRDELFED